MIPASVAEFDAIPLTEEISAHDYGSILERRCNLWLAQHPTHPRLIPPLLEWFVRDADVPFVLLPEQSEKPAKTAPKKPRQYRSSESLRAERDDVERRMAAIAEGDEVPDRAAANLSPFSRSRAASRAGRKRFAKLDRDLERYTALRKRRDTLTSRILSAEVRENRKVDRVMSSQAGATR